MPNTEGRVVRKRRLQPPVGRVAGLPAPDARVERTREALTHALIELVLAKRWAAITVQDLLDRAQVGRSTFYAHYRSKDDLLMRSFVQLLDLLDSHVDDASAGRRIAPVAELFAHVGEFTPFHRALARAKMLERLFQAGAVHMAGRIEQRLAARRPAGTRAPEAAATAIAAHAHAGALFALLRWWIEQEAPPSPQHMDAAFHALVARGSA